MKKSILLGLILSVSAWATEWKHVNLQSSDGTKIAIDYQAQQEAFSGCYKCTIDTKTTAAWINVSAPNLGANDTVHAVVLNFRLGNHSYAQPEVVELNDYHIDLHWDENAQKFTATLPALSIYRTGYPGTWKFRQEIAIVVNGQWLNDPMSNTHNFKFSLYK